MAIRIRSSCVQWCAKIFVTTKTHTANTVKKTIEFKAYPNRAAIEQINLNIEACRIVWNESLAIRLEQRHRYQRDTHAHPVPFGLKLKPLARKKGKYTGFGIVRMTPKGEPCAPRCPLRVCTPRITRKLDANPKALGSVPTRGYWQGEGFDLFQSKKVCTRFLIGMCKFKFGDAWGAYEDKNRPNSKQPKFKSMRDKPRSLINAAGNVKVERLGDDNGYVVFPLGLKMRIKGLFQRLTTEHSQVSIVIRPSGYYVQFCVPCDSEPLKPSPVSVGIDPGVRAIATLSTGHSYAPNAKLSRLQTRGKRIQRKLSRQTQGSKSWEKTKVLLAANHEKIARSRNAFNHKISSKIVRMYGAIAFEDTKLANMVRSAKPKEDPNKPGHYLPNGASAKSGLSRAILNAGIADLREKTKAKAKAAGRTFVLVSAPYTSQTCNACGHVDAGNRPRGGLKFKCLACGHQNNADINAAQNIRDNAKATYPNFS
jgi:putative transposase